MPTTSPSPSLLRAARSVGRAWADNGCTCDASDLELTAEDCHYLKISHPRAWARDVVRGDALPVLERACRDAYAKRLRA